MRLVLSLLIVLQLMIHIEQKNALAQSEVLQAEQQRIEMIDKMAPTVVAIFAAGGRGGGSGVLISEDGYALTNFHVVKPTGPFMKCGLNNGELYDAVIVGVDPTGDVALIKLLGRESFPYSPMGDSDQLTVGDWVYAMGNPFLLATDFHPTVTYGMVSGLHRYQYPAGTFLEYTDCIQVDTSINPGNSGGPLFNTRGEVIGINGRISINKRGRVNVGAGYAISINQIKHFMDHLRSGRIVDHATLGATVTTEKDGTVVVGNIIEESEAYRRGLRIDDEIVSFAGRNIRSVNQFKNILGIYPNGWKLPLVYRRDSRKHDIVVRLRSLHREHELYGKERPKKKNAKKPNDKLKKKPTLAIPQKYKHMYSSKRGFANLYFNKLELDRTLKAFDKFGDYSNLNGKWLISGKVDNKTPFQLSLTDKLVGIKIGNQNFIQDLDAEEIGQEPPQSGGLLYAMQQFKVMLTEGADGFDTLYYFGSEPLDGTGERVDVLISEYSVATSRWYFSKSDGRLVGFDTQLEPDRDECEIRMGRLREFGKQQFPAKLIVNHAGKEFAQLIIDQISLAEEQADAK